MSAQISSPSPRDNLSATATATVSTMGVACMDSFLKSLLVDQQSTVRTNECIVVVDNAKLHPESWSELPQRMRTSLLLKNDPIFSAPPLTRRKKKGIRRHRSLEEGQMRWSSTNSTKKMEHETERSQPAAALAPPSYPQRQVSSGITPPACPQRQLSTGMAPPPCPQRQVSIEVTPQTWMAKMKNNSPSSVLESLAEEGPRMPKRQASVALETADTLLPPPPMMLPSFQRSEVQRPTSAKGETLLFSPDFSKKVKRSNVSLLDDDDEESESEEKFDLRSFKSI